MVWKEEDREETVQVQLLDLWLAIHSKSDGERSDDVSTS